MVRATGQALDRVGNRLQGSYYLEEHCNFPLFFALDLTYVSSIKVIFTDGSFVAAASMIVYIIAFIP